MRYEAPDLAIRQRGRQAERIAVGRGKAPIAVGKPMACRLGFHRRPAPGAAIEIDIDAGVAQEAFFHCTDRLPIWRALSRSASRRDRHIRPVNRPDRSNGSPVAGCASPISTPLAVSARWAM